MSFWNQHQKLLLQRWEMYRQRIDREVAERRRDLVRRNLRQSSEWNSYEPYSDWYLERDVEAFLAAVDEVSGSGPHDIDDESLDEMDRMLADIIDRRRQLAPPEALQAFGSQHARVKGSARVGLLRVQSQRRSDRERGTSPQPRAPIRRKGFGSPESPAPAPQSISSGGSAGTAVATQAAAVAAPPAEDPALSDARRLADNLRRLGQLIQRLPDTEEQAESLEELQFVAEEATAEPDRRKLRMVASALERIAARFARADADLASPAASLAQPIRRWFQV